MLWSIRVLLAQRQLLNYCYSIWNSWLFQFREHLSLLGLEAAL